MRLHRSLFSFFLLLGLLLVVNAGTSNLRKLQVAGEERDDNQGKEGEDGTTDVDVDKQQQQVQDHSNHQGHNHGRMLQVAGEERDDNQGKEGEDGTTDVDVDKQQQQVQDHSNHQGHNHGRRILQVAGEERDDNQGKEGEDGTTDVDVDKQQVDDPRASLCKMPGQSPCPNGPGTCTLLFCDCPTMGNCRMIDPPKV